METLIQEALQDLRSEKITKPCYNKISLPHRDIFTLLKEAYDHEVTSKGGTTNEFSELEKVAQWLSIENRKPWLVIYGLVGNGKTTTVKSIIHCYNSLRTISRKKLSDRWKMRDDEIAFFEKMQDTPEIRFTSALDIVNMNKEDISALKSQSILIIDDLGIEPTKVMNYGTETSPIAELLLYRYERRQMTIITTNKDFDQIAESYGDRISDRMREVASRIGYSSQSYR